MALGSLVRGEPRTKKMNGAEKRAKVHERFSLPGTLALMTVFRVMRAGGSDGHGGGGRAG